MKKAFIAAAAFTFMALSANAQVFTENMGTIPVEMTVSELNAENGFTNNDKFTYAGNAMVQPIGASKNNTDYVDMFGNAPSLGSNVRISDKHDCYFQINGINTEGMKKPIVGFAILKGVRRFDASDLAVEYSLDGHNWVALSFEPLPVDEDSALQFFYRKTSPLPNSPALAIRFRQNGYNCVYRIDDVCVGPKSKK